MNKYFKEIIIFSKNEILYGGHLQCLSAISIAWMASFLMKIPAEWQMFAIIYLNTYIAYAYNRHQEIEDDSSDNIERTKHLKKYQKKIPFLVIGAFGLILLILLERANELTLCYALILLILGLIYTQWLKPGTRKIPLLKNISVATAFVLGVGLIFPYNSIDVFSFRESASFIGSFIFLRILLMQIFLDLKDHQGDAARKLKTLVVLKGKGFTLKFLRWASPVSVLPLILGIIYGFLPTITLIVLLTVLFDYLAIDLVKNNNQISYLMQGAQGIIWSALLILGQALYLCIFG